MKRTQMKNYDDDDGDDDDEERKRRQFGRYGFAFDMAQGELRLHSFCYCHSLHRSDSVGTIQQRTGGTSTAR